MTTKLKWMGILITLTTLLYSVNVLAWDSVESPTADDTHKMIVEQGLRILENDLGNNENPDFLADLQTLDDNLSQLRAGAVWPDFNPDGYKLYQDHFYDPDTGTNFTNGQIPDTAESMTRLYVAIAVDKWKNGDYSGAVFELGTAAHYYSDLNEPHHASNQTGGELTAHTEFEQWVESVKEDFAVSTSSYTTDSDYFTDTVANYRYITDFLTDQSDFDARAAKSLVGLAQMTSSWDDWEYVAQETLENAQIGMALLLYRFLHEVETVQPSTNPDPIDKFHVVFKVADEYEAGTDDYVYFGMELNDGRTVEFSCDVPGNDFFRDLRWGYEFNITDPTFKASDVKRVWIRKKDYTWQGDDLKLEYMDVYMKGINVLHQPINQWLGKGGWWYSDVTYNIDVDGLMY